MIPRFIALMCGMAMLAGAAAKFSVSFPSERSSAPLDGRILLVLSTDPSAEPRMQIDDTPKTQMIFGIDIDSLAPGKSAIVDDTAFGYPIRRLSQVPQG